MKVKDAIKAAAGAAGLSLNAYIVAAVDKQMNASRDDTGD